MNFWDILVLAVIAVAVFFAVRAIGPKGTRTGPCGRSCDGCGHCGGRAAQKRPKNE